jgi:hypothetical protein
VKVGLGLTPTIPGARASDASACLRKHPRGPAVRPVR